MTEEKSGFSRRTVVKGAAWSVPVIAAAVAMPLASASTGFNATVTGYCTNDYDISVLEGIVGRGLVGTAEGLLRTLLGLEPGATRGFTVTATTGAIPVGTQYVLSDPNALLTVSGLESVISTTVAGVATTDGGFLITLNQAIAEGGTFNVNVYDALVNVGALSSFTLTQVQEDDLASDNVGTTGSLAALAINLGNLSPLLSGSLAVQTCDL